MSERKNIKRNAIRKKINERPFYCGIQMSSKKKEPKEQKEQKRLL